MHPGRLTAFRPSRGLISGVLFNPVSRQAALSFFRHERDKCRVAGVTDILSESFIGERRKVGNKKPLGGVAYVIEVDDVVHTLNIIQRCFSVNTLTKKKICFFHPPSEQSKSGLADTPSPRWVPYTASHLGILSEDTRLQTVKLAKPSIPIYSASGERVMLNARQVKLLKEAGRFARLIERKRDKAITRGYLTAMPDEIGKRITAAPTVVQVLPTTWTHAESLRAGL